VIRNTRAPRIGWGKKGETVPHEGGIMRKFNAMGMKWVGH